MEDPLSPAASITGSLWEADSDTSVDSGNIYEDLGNPTASGSDSEVSDADIFQELGVVTNEGEQLPSCKESFETQEKADALSNGKKKEVYQNDRIISKTTSSHQDASSYSNDTTALALSQAEKEEGKKKDKAGTVIRSGSVVSENSTKNNVPPDSPNTRSKMKKLLQKEAEDSTRKQNFECQAKNRSSNGCLAEHEDGSKNGVKIKDPNQDIPLTLPMTSKNKDLEFILSRVMKNKSSSEKTEHVPPDQHSLAKEGNNLNLLVSKSRVTAQNKNTSGGNKPSSKIINGRSSSDAAMEEKNKEAQKIETNSKSCVRRETTETEGLSGTPTTEAANSNPGSLVDKIMCLAGFSQRPTAADFMTEMDTCKKYKIPKLSQVTKKSKSKEKNTQLDLFEDLLVGRDRDELLKEIEKLKTERDSLQERLHTSWERCSGLEKDNEVLLNNMSSLWKTSMAQLRQRSHELATVRREKEAIIFRRAMRQVPRDELDRIASHIAAYDKEEFAEFISKLKEKEEDWEKKECVCARKTPTTRRIGSVAQRVRQAARGTRLSPSSDSEAQTLRNLLGKKGETVTHSEEKPGNWSKARHLTYSLRSQKCLFPSEGGLAEPEVSRCIWDRLGKNPLDRRTGIEDKGKETCTEEGEVVSEKTGMEFSSGCAHGSSKKPLLGEAVRGKRKSVFSRLSIKRTINNQEESASVNSDAPASDFLSVPDSQLSDLEIYQEKRGKITEVKKTGTLDDKCRMKERSAKCYQSDPPKDLLSKLQVCTSSEFAGGPSSTALKLDKTGAHSSGDTALSAQEPQDKSEFCSDNEDEMLSKTLFGQRMKRKMEKSTKPPPVTKQQKDMSPLSSPVVNEDMSPKATQHKQSAALDKVRPVANSVSVNIRKPVSAETEGVDTVINRASDEGDMIQDVLKLDIQNDIGSVENDECEMRKKQSSTWKDSDRQKAEDMLKQGAVSRAKEDKNPPKKGRESHGNIENNSVVVKETGRSHIDNSRKQIDETKLERNESTSDRHVMKSSEKMMTTECERRQDTRGAKPDWEDIDKEEIDTAILSLAKLRSAFHSQERKVKTKNKKLKKQRHLLSLFGGDDVSDKVEMTGKEACKENQETEIHRKVSRNIAASEKQVIEGNTKKKSTKPSDANRHISKEMEELLDMVENAEECENHNTQLSDWEKKQKGKSVTKSSTEYVGLDIDKEGPKGKETSIVAHQVENSEEALTENVNYIDRKGRSKSLKKASVPNAEDESKSLEKELTPASGTEDNTLVSDKNTQKLFEKFSKVKRKPDEKVTAESASRNVSQQTKERRKRDPREEDESTCQHTQSKETSDKRVKHSRSAENDNGTEVTEDSVLLSQNKCNGKKTSVMSRKDSKKKKNMSKTKVSKRSNKKSDPGTEASFSEQKGKNEGAPSQTSSEALGCIGETNAVDNLSFKTPTMDPRAGNASALNDIRDIQQQNQECDEEDNTIEEEDGGIENNSLDSKRETATQKEVNTAEAVRASKSDQDTFEGLQKPVQNMKDAEYVSCIKNSNESDVCAVDPASNASKDSTEEDSQESDILKSLLGTNYDEDSLFLQEEELLYDEGSEEDEDIEEEHSVPVNPNVKKAGDGNDENKSEERKGQEVESQMKNKIDPKKHHRRDEIDKGAHNTLICKDKEMRDADKTSCSPRSGKAKEQEIRTRNKPQSDSPQGGLGLGNEDTLTVKKQIRGDIAPKTGEKPIHSTIPPVSPPSQKGSLSKLLGGRIKKLTVSPRDKGCKSTKEGVSPLMVREGRLQERRGEKPELKTSRGEGESPRSQVKRKETPEKGHRGRKAQNSHILLSQNRKTPPRLREGRLGSRKRERVSESDTLGKRERSPERSPRTRRERSSPRQREPLGEREQPASKRRRVSVKSRLSFPHNSDEENITRPARWQPSVLEVERTRTSSRHGNQSGEKRSVADSHTRELSWQDGEQHSSQEDGKHVSTSTVPVDSKLLQSVLAQSPSKLMAQGDEKEEGELDEEEEEGEDSTTDKNIKNHKTCDTEKTKVDNLKKQSEVSKDQKDVEDTDKNKFKRNSKEKQIISLDTRDMQGAKANKTDKENTLISTNKEDPKLGDAEAHIVSQNQMNNKQANQEKQSHKSGAMERENNARSSQRMTGDSKQQQTSRTKPLPSRKKSSLMGALQDHEIEKPRRDGKGALEHSSNIEEEDHKCKRSCAPINENVLRKKSPLLESLQNQEIEKAPEHSSNTEEDQKQKGRNCTPVNKNVLRKKSPLLEALQDQEIKKPNRDGKGAPKHSSRIEDQKCKRRSCAPMDENATFYPGDLYQAMQAKAKSQLLKDTSASSNSSVSDDTIDLMVRQHNENFSDITNASDDSETSLLKYIADDNDDNNGDDENEEEEEIHVYDISTLKEDMAHSSGERENEGETHCKDGKKQAGMQNNVTPCGDESETMQDAEKRSTQEHGDIIPMDPTSPHHRDITRVPVDECESDDDSSSPASPESTAGISKQNPPTAVSMMQHSDSEEEEGSREQNTPTPVSVMQNSDSEEGHGNQNTWNTPTPVSVAQHSDSEEEEGSREQNTPAPVSVTQHSDSEEEEGSGEQNTSTSVSVTQHSSSEEEEGSGEQNTPTPVSVTQHSDSEEEGGSGEQGNQTPVSVTQHSDSEAEEGSGGLGLSAAIGFLPDSSEEDCLSSSEESELDVETVDSEPEHTGKEIQQSSLNGNSYGNISVNDQLSSTRQNEDDTELVTEPLDEDRLTTETENIDNNSSSSDESDSDSDCQCSDCNSSSSSSSNCSSGSDSSSSISSESEVDDTVLDGAEDVGRPKHTGEDSKESYGQASNQSYSEPPTEAAHEPKSPNKAGHKSPKKTPKKTPSRTFSAKLGASQISTTPFKKTPRKSPCRKTPCKKSPLKKAQGKTPKKGKRVLAPPPAASPVKEPQDTFLTSPGVDNEANDNTRIVSPPNTQQDPDVETNHESRLIKHPGSPGKTQDKSTTPPLSDSGSSVSKSRQRQVTPLSDSCISQSFQLKKKISPLDSSFSISKTYHLKRRVSPVKTMNAVPSMPFIETGIVPLKGRSASFASSPSRTMKLSCTDTTPVISVVHSSMGDESQAPQRVAIKTPKKVTQEVNVTTPTNNKPVAARKRQRSPNSVLLITRNIKGKRMRTLSPSMYDRVSPRKLFSATTNVKQKTAITAHSSSENCLGSSANNVKTSVSKEIVVPVTIRRAKRQLNLQLSSSPVQHFSFSSTSHQEDTTTPAGQSEGGSKGQVLRKSPRKPKPLTKQSW